MIRTWKAKQVCAWKYVDIATSFQNQIIPYLAVGRKIARFTGFLDNLRQTCFMFETWLLLEPGCSNFASHLSSHYRWDLLNKIADRVTWDSDQLHSQLNQTKMVSKQSSNLLCIGATTKLSSTSHYMFGNLSGSQGNLRRVRLTVSNYPTLSCWKVIFQFFLCLNLPVKKKTTLPNVLTYKL